VPAIDPGLSVQFPDGKPLNMILPVATVQVGCIMVLIVGAEGVTGCGLIITLELTAEMHPTELVTVYEYVPAPRDEMFVLLVLPVIDPGLIVQSPAGKPSNTTFPVATLQVGCVIAPGTGAAGVSGCVLIITSSEEFEVHPETLVTVKLYVPGVKPVTVLLVPVPVIAPGLIVQVPEGKPLKSTLPVATVQVGCITVPTTGADGVAGCALIIAFADAAEVQPTELVTV
jgi:hypothetical protein